MSVNDEKVKEILQKKNEQLNILKEKVKAQEQKYLKEQRDENLIRWGLFEKVYLEEYREGVLMDKDDRPYEKKALEVSDEVYNELLEVEEERQKLIDRRSGFHRSASENESSSFLSVAFGFIGVAIFIVAFIIGIVLFASGNGGGLIAWGTGFISGLIYIALGQIIKSLNRIEIMIKREKNHQKENN